MSGGNTATFRYAVVGIMLVTVDPHERWEYCDIPMCGGRYHASYGRATRALGILRHSDMRW